MLQEDSRSFNDKCVRMGIAQVTTANECELNFMCDIGVGTFSKRLSKSCGYIKASATSSTTQPQLKCNRTESDVEYQLMFFCVQFLECGFSISVVRHMSHYIILSNFCVATQQMLHFRESTNKLSQHFCYEEI